MALLENVKFGSTNFFLFWVQSILFSQTIYLLIMMNKTIA